MLLSVSELLKRGLEVYKANTRLFLLYAALVSGPFTVLAVLYAYVFPPATATPNMNPAEVTSFLLAVVASVWSLWVSLAFIRVIWAKVKGGAVKPIKEELGAALPLLPRAIGAAILGGLLAFFGFLFLIIPGVIVAVWFTFASQEVAIENRTATDALRESKRLVSGRWSAIFWRVFATAAVFIFLTSAPQGLVRLIFESLSRILHLTQGGFGQNTLILLSDLIGIAITLVVTPFGTATQIIFYDDAKKTGSQSPSTPA